MSAVAGGTPALARGRGLRALASPKLTLAGMGLLAAGGLVAAYANVPASWPLALPLALLVANLAAAVAYNAAFRRQPALLAFHVALLAVVALALAGRLTYLKGTLELTTGSAFTGELTQQEAGPLHRDRLEAAAFTNEGFTIRYSPGRNRDETTNRVWWIEGEAVREAEVGDQRPLERAGYRFQVSSNKGFAPVLAWRAPDGSLHRGAVHMPSYPLYDYRQVQEWTPPGSAAPLWMMLEIGEVLIDPARRSEFRLPRASALVVRAGAQRVTLHPGDEVALGGGVLRYERLTTWMGYDVSHDPTLPWMLAASLAAVGFLGVHFARRFAKERWDA